MTEEKQTGGLDYFKAAAAFLVAAIHTSPLASFSAEGDFIVTRVMARVAVPFFLMTTGYFLLPQYLFGRSMDQRPLLCSLKKFLVLYLTGIFLYLPVNLYAGQFKELEIGAFFRMVLMDGTFYHLWYLPAAALGTVIIRGLGRKMPFKGLLGISAALYLIGMFGDSYYGLAKQAAFLRKIYDVLFTVSSYTRNGLFYTPVFLVMGAGIYHRRCAGGRAHLSGKRGRKENGRIVLSAAGFALSMSLMAAEGILLYRQGLQRHDSMYIMLPIVMFFLFQILLAAKTAPVKILREISMWIYLIHPLCIIFVRGVAKAIYLEYLLVENSLVHYLAVCAVSGVSAVIIVKAGNKVMAYFHCFGKKEQDFAEGRAWIELSRENLTRNVESLQSLLSGERQLMPVVKADAYGHGAVLVAKELQKMGMKVFGTACAAEGAELRKHGITGEILVLGYTHPKEFPLLRKYHLTQTIVDYAYGKLLNDYGRKIKVHVKIDTGMHRLGERAEKSKEILRIFRMRNLKAEGIYTHLCADETKDAADQVFTKRQGALFYRMVGKLEKQGFSDLKTHLLASYGLINYPELGGDYVRVGIALYGLLSDEKAKERCPVKLEPVLSLKARIAVVKDLFQGERVGYGLDYEAQEDRKIAVLSIGYADGLPRSLSGGRGRVLIHGQSAPVIGRICMDQTIVDITGIPGVRTGETAVVIGRSGKEEITAYELAENAGTITNEILSRMGKRLKRVMI